MKTKKMITWVDIPAADIKRAVSFYNAVLHLDLRILDCGEEQMACFPNGEGALSQAKDFNPSADGSIISFHIDEAIEQVLKIVEKQGGKTIQGKTKIEAEGRGYFALFLDCEGNKMGLYQD